MMLPGVELAQQILQTDGVQAMQLVVFLVVLGWVLATWLNGRAVAQMSRTQHEMSHTNAQFIDSDAKKTEVLQATVDEVKALREDFERIQGLNVKVQESAAQALYMHDGKVEARVKNLIDHVTMVVETQTQAIQQSVAEMLDEAILSVGSSTMEVVKPALEVLVEIKASIGAIKLLQQGQLDILKQQQEQMALLKAHHEAYLRLLESQLTSRTRDIAIDETGDIYQ